MSAACLFPMFLHKVEKDFINSILICVENITDANTTEIRLQVLLTELFFYCAELNCKGDW